MANTTQLFTTTFATLSTTLTSISDVNTTKTKPLDFFDYSNYFLSGLTILLVPTTLLSQSLLAYQIRKKKLAHTLSPILLINLGCWINYSFNCALFRPYLLSQMGYPNKSSYILLYAGTLNVACSQMVTVSVFFLALDRIVGMISPTVHRKHQRTLTDITLTFIFFCFLFNILTILIYQPLPPTPTTPCDSIVCIQGKEAASIIYGVGLCITVSTVSAGLVFNLILYKFWNKYDENVTSKAQFRKANYFVLAACLCEIFLRFIPQIFNFIFLDLDIRWAVFFAFLTATFISLDGAINAAVYRYMILRRVNESGPTPVVLLSTDASGHQSIYSAAN